MTNEEFNERYSEVDLTFSSYYKYTFSFTGVGPEGEIITCRYGGNSDNIYRYHLIPTDKVKVKHYDEWMEIRVVKGDKELYSFFDY